MNCPHCNGEINAGELLGKESGKNMTKEERSTRARKAGLARWKKVREKEITGVDFSESLNLLDNL